MFPSSCICLLPLSRLFLRRLITSTCSCASPSLFSMGRTWRSSSSLLTKCCSISAICPCTWMENWCYARYYHFNAFMPCLHHLILFLCTSANQKINYSAAAKQLIHSRLPAEALRYLMGCCHVMQRIYDLLLCCCLCLHLHVYGCVSVASLC